MGKIEEMNKAYLDPAVQEKIKENIENDPELWEILKTIKDIEIETPRDVVALWIYKNCLAPLGW